jgi:beta-glucosidase
MYFAGKPQFAFGHGLSYTTFGYGGLRLSAPRVAADGTTTVSVTVQNTGKRAGSEVIQLYVHDVEARVKRPAKELRGFERISLAPKQKWTVTFALPASELAFYDEKAKKFVVEPGAFDILIGASSEDIRLKTRLDVR